MDKAEEKAEKDVFYMRRALALAERGAGFVSPNPPVGAVIVKDGRIIGEGWHRCYGDLHAEREALKACAESPAGAAMYVTLEPCCHWGRQPPCTDAVLEAGISRVVVGADDPNPLAAGKGIRILREHGIEVTRHVLQKECERQMEVFLYYIRTGRPFVTMKYAMTMDGKIAAYTGLSRWVTGGEARRHVQEQRGRNTGIMVGVGTVLQDDPLLTCRLSGMRTPVRIICDTHLRTPPDCRLVKTAAKVPTILATCCGQPERIRPYEERGCKVLTVDGAGGHVDLNRLMSVLGSEKIDSILLEGGGTLNWAALESGIVRKVQAYIAPKFFGGSGAKTPVEGLGAASPAEAFALRDCTVRKLGEDFLIEGYLKEERCLQES